VAGTPAGVGAQAGGGAAFLPTRRSLASLAWAAADCRGCDLWAHATQTVFGEGGARARLMLVGEQPGDAEDRAGHPFVGPAGRILDRALAQAGIDRGRVYTTNAVKHFRWEGRGKRRLHKRPSAAQVSACRPWLDAEIDVVGPSAIACLGVTAAAAVLGRPVTLSRERGTPVAGPGLRPTVVTIHPSAVLRTRDDAARHAQLDGLVHDLGTAWEAARASS